MNIKEKLLDLINSDTNIHKYRETERLIVIMLEDYLKSQDKQFYSESKNGFERFDMVLPDGIGEEEGSIAVEIKMVRNSSMLYRMIYDIIGRFSMNRGEEDKLLLIILDEIPERLNERILEKNIILILN